MNKGIRLGQLDRSEEAIAVYEDLLKRYRDNENTEIQEQCLSALDNNAELFLVMSNYAKAQTAIKQVLEQVDSSNQEFAIMSFLQWLVDLKLNNDAEKESSIETILTAIDALNSSVEFSWGFSEIQPLMTTLNNNQQQKAQCFIAYFESNADEENRKELQACLNVENSQ